MTAARLDDIPSRELAKTLTINGSVWGARRCLREHLDIGAVGSSRRRESCGGADVGEEGRGELHRREIKELMLLQ